MSLPIPTFDPLGLPLPGPYLLALSYLTLTLHFVAMQFTVGGALLLLFTWRRQPGVARFFGTGLPLGFSYLVTFGIPPLLFVQVIYGQFFYTSSVLVGAFWISVIPLIIVGYGAAYWHRMTRETASRFQWVLIATVALTVLLVGYIYVNNLTLSMRPDRWLAHYRAHPAGGALNSGEPTLLARYTLFVAPAFAAAGVSLLIRAGYLRKKGAAPEAEVSSRIGIRSMLISAVLELGAVAGLWTTLPPVVKHGVLHSGALPFLAVGAMVFGLASLGVAVVARSRSGIGMPVLAAHLYVAAVACLVIVRDQARQLYLHPYFSLDTAPVLPQWRMATAFGVILLVGLVFLVVMTKQMVTALERRAAR